MADADALHALIQGNVDDIHRPRVTDSLLQLTEKSCRRRRIPIPMTIASHVTGIGRLPDCYVYILIQEGAGAIGGLKAAVRAAISVPRQNHLCQENWRLRHRTRRSSW